MKDRRIVYLALIMTSIAILVAGFSLVGLYRVAFDAGVEVDLLKHGADDYIRKPIDPARFVVRVQAVLRRARG